MKAVHENILELQKTIDSYLDYQYTYRKKRSLQTEELFNFLKTTKYSLNSQRYFRYLMIYNSSLYFLEEEKIYCRDFPAEHIEERYKESKIKMTQKEIP